MHNPILIVPFSAFSPWMKCRGDVLRLLQPFPCAYTCSAQNLCSLHSWRTRRPLGSGQGCMIVRVREEVNLLHGNGPQLTLAGVGINSSTVGCSRAGEEKLSKGHKVSQCVFYWLLPWLPVRGVPLHHVAVMPGPWWCILEPRGPGEWGSDFFPIFNIALTRSVCSVHLVWGCQTARGSTNWFQPS